jgi:hypothetical protein
MSRLPQWALKRWTLQIGCVAGLALALGSRAQSATSLSIELPKEARAGAAVPAVMVIHNLPLPASGAIVTVNAHLCWLQMPVPLMSLFVLGGGSAGGTVDRDMRSVIEASPDMITALQSDPSATLTLTVCGNKGRDRTCTTSAPFPVQFYR